MLHQSGFPACSHDAVIASALGLQMAPEVAPVAVAAKTAPRRMSACLFGHKGMDGRESIYLFGGMRITAGTRNRQAPGLCCAAKILYCVCSAAWASHIAQLSRAIQWTLPHNIAMSAPSPCGSKATAAIASTTYLCKLKCNNNPRLAGCAAQISLR